MEVRTGTRVVAHRRDGVRVTRPTATAGAIPARTVLWAAGVQASPFARIVADGDRRADRSSRTGHRRARPDDPRPPGDLRRRRRRGPAVEAGRADAGRRAGRDPGRLVRRARSSGGASSVDRTSRSATATTATSRSSGGSPGVTNIGWLGPFGRQGGFPAWALWLGIHIFYLIGFSNRIVVLVRWAWTS